MSLIPGLEHLVRAAVGWPGLIIIFIYSILIAFILPTPSEIVLAAPLNLNLPYTLETSLIITISAIGKTAGSLLAFKIGQGFKRSNYILNKLKESPIDIIEWTESQTVKVAQKWGYPGLAILLSIPFFPDTVSIYAFSLLENNYIKFAIATFLGSTGRLIITITFIKGTLNIL